MRILCFVQFVLRLFGCSSQTRLHACRRGAKSKPSRIYEKITRRFAAWRPDAGRSSHIQRCKYRAKHRRERGRLATDEAKTKCRERCSDRLARQARSCYRATPSAVSEQFSELIGCPISKSLTTCCVCFKLRSLPSTGVTRLQRYCEPLRHPRAPSLSLAGVRLVITDHAMGLPVLRTLSLCTCRRQYPV
ncbi:hypothetical protein SAMN05444171_6663 [Bradyrhizobium lablabi]|uniref:Uncharacterized protein n=1 Tax=Bradyrhizobium lablabi TaxID=722472 RepID=A0A1H5GZD5_9BRAD|nr:hypothetical protein SAMN05444171_6663 [Bradyrhizobium lablabi]